MELTKEILLSLKDSGKDICVYSDELINEIRKFHPNNFSKYSKTSYYFWIKKKRPIPLSVISQIIKDKKFNELKIESFSTYGGNQIRFPDEENLFFSYLLGLILGDGCLVHNDKGDNRHTYLIKITFREAKEAIKINKQVKKMFGVSGSIYRGRGCYDLCIYSKPLVLILNKKYQIPIGKKYNYICVPNLILKGNCDMKKAFLKGVFDSDGNLYDYRDTKAVQLRQKSGKFLNELKNLFSEINLDFNNPYKDNANNSWVLWSSKKDLVDNFINCIIDFNCMLG